VSKPTLFVGSSSEGLEVARAVRALLAEDAEVTLWNEGFLTITDTFIESLVNAAPRFDFAALVLTPDDLTTSRRLPLLVRVTTFCLNWDCLWVDWDDLEHLSFGLAENGSRFLATLPD
jgi:Predicted nucleotide-binding protein containing TIR-like domain